MAQLEEVSGNESEQHQTRRQLQIPSPLPTNEKLMGIPDDIVNVCFLTVPRNAKVINQRGCQYCSVSGKRCLVVNVTDNEPVWRRAIDHSSIQNRTSEPKARSLDSVRVQMNEEITVATRKSELLDRRVCVWVLKKLQVRHSSPAHRRRAHTRSRCGRHDRGKTRGQKHPLCMTATAFETRGVCVSLSRQGLSVCQSSLHCDC